MIYTGRLFHEDSQFQQASIVKGSLDEKLPSYELLKMLKIHFSKVTVQ